MNWNEFYYYLAAFYNFFTISKNLYLGCFLDFLPSPLPRLLFRLFAISMNLPRLLFTLFSPAFSKSLKSSRRKIKVLKNYLAASAASAAPAAFWCSRRKVSYLGQIIFQFSTQNKTLLDMYFPALWIGILAQAFLWY